MMDFGAFGFVGRMDMAFCSMILTIAVYAVKSRPKSSVAWSFATGSLCLFIVELADNVCKVLKP